MFTTPDNLRWARNVANSNPLPAGDFVTAIALAYLKADDMNAAILYVAITTFREKYPKWDIPEREY